MLTIDVHHHILPDFFWRETNEQHGPVGGIAPPPWSKESALAFMDDAGIDVAVTSISTPGVHTGDDMRARSLARRCNELAAKLVQARPDRFGAFACLPLPDVDGSFAELSYALDVLKLDGVVLFSNARGVYLGDARFDAVLDELERRRAVVFVHPTASPDPAAHALGLPDSLIDCVADTTRAIAHLHYSNTFARTPNVKYIFSHAGGTIPYLASRFAVVDEMGVIGGGNRRGTAADTFRRLYWDTAPSWHDPVLQPMGGVRDSGWGRTGPDSLKEFQDVIWINSHSGPRQIPVLNAVAGPRGPFHPSQANRMHMNRSEYAQALFDQVATGQLNRRHFLTLASAAGLTACASGSAAEHAVATGENQARNQAKPKDSYDYIVVGAGASGSVIAGELSKTGAEVLVVESGGADDAPTISNPSVWFYNVGGPLDWKLPIAPAPQLNNRKFNMALGHVLGGGSSINAMVWSRGLASDYDAWERNGASGWSFRDVLPTFKAQEDWEGGGNEWRGVGGPVHVRRAGTPHPTAPAFLEAARQMGFATVDDMNGPMRPGAGYINMNIAADGSRVSAARAFLRPNLGRPNITLLLNANVTKVVFEGDRATGVQIMTGDGVRNVRASWEVILAAGTIHSARVLMLSGVGNAEELQKLGIAPIANLRGVGQNLQDHVLVSGVVYKYKGKMPDRPVNSNAVEAEVYLSSGLSSHPADINLVLEQLPIATPEASARFGAPPTEGFTIAPALVQPTSRGQVRLASADWRDAPIIEGNYLGTDHDLAAIVRAIELARELGRQTAMDGVREVEVVPGPSATSRQDLVDLARTASASFGHAVGTAKIGVDADAVVDSNLRVRGVRGLRVADASVMPSVVAAPTNAPAIMIGGRAAALIKSAG